MTIIPQDDTPRKQCKACEVFFPATLQFFGKHSTTKDHLRTSCKVCRKAESKAYNDAHVEDRKRFYQEHREEKNEYSKRYQETHRREIAAQRHQKYELYREENIERARIYRQTHNEEVRAASLRYYRNNKEESIKRMRAYRAAHREEYLERDRRYYHTHREQRQSYNRLHYREKGHVYYERYREKKIAYSRQYRQTERGRLYTRAHWLNRRMRKRAIPGTLTKQAIQDKLKAQHYTCYYCFAKFEKIKGKHIYHLEHTIPISRTAANPRHDINYVVLACPSCNMKKGAKLPHEWGEGGRLL